MPSLLELQHAVRSSLLAGDEAAAPYVVAAGLAPAQRLNVHRNTLLGTLHTALRLSYPAVQRLVGAAFFEGAAQTFALGCPPSCADLNAYGSEFAQFLQQFEPASTVPYLPDVARLEWAVNRALHAAEAPALDVAELTALPPRHHNRVRFTAHPSVSLLRAPHPVDAIWRAVLQGDDAAMAGVDLADGPVHLVVRRLHGDVDVQRVDAPAWDFARALFDGRTLGEALAGTQDPHAPEWLARHLAEGSFIGFRWREGCP